MKQGAECLTDIPKGKVNTPRTNRLSQRMEIAVLHRCNISSPCIAWFSDCHLRTVGRWLVRIASGEPITDRPRSGRPPLYSEQTCLKTIAFFCQTPPLPGCSRWTLRDAEEYLIAHDAKNLYHLSAQPFITTSLRSRACLPRVQIRRDNGLQRPWPARSWRANPNAGVRQV